MLVIRLQRTGRSGHAMFRIIVQDSRKSPTSGKQVAWLGHYDPHSKDIKLDKEKAETFLKNGAQPSKRVAGLLKSQGVKLPKWVVFSPDVKKAVRNPEKRRSTAPEKPEKPAEPITKTPTEEPENEKTVPEAASEVDSQKETPETTEQAEEPEEVASETEPEVETETTEVTEDK